MKLRPYQKKIVDAVAGDLQRKNKSLIVVPTGGGKTVIFSFIINRLNTKTLVVAHTRELLKQIQQTVYAVCDNPHSVQVDSIQRLMHPHNVDKWDPSHKLVIIDECHRSAARSYRKFIDKFPESTKFIGASATPFRSDSQSIASIFGLPSVPCNMIDLINEKYLTNLRGFRIKTNTSLIEVDNRGSDFNVSTLGSVINVKNRNELIVSTYLTKCLNKKTLVFCATVKHADDLRKEFLLQGVRCECIHGNLSTSARDDIIQRFKNGTTRVLTNCNILTEGFDEPSIEVIFMCRPTMSKKLYIQMVGRGCRVYPKKAFCDVYEFTDNDCDVCDLRDLLEIPRNKVSIVSGNLITKVYKEACLKPEIWGETVFAEQMDIVKSPYEKKATSFQKNYLMEIGVPFDEQISSMEADFLIANHMEDNHGVYSKKSC